MGIKIEKAEGRTAEAFFRQTSINHFTEIFPPDVASLAKETFGREDYFYVAKDGEKILGAMKFSIVGRVGQLDALVIPPEFSDVKKEVIRKRLFEKFIELCHSCHKLFLWIPYQHKKAIGVYKKYGFEERFRFKNSWFGNDYILMIK